MSGKSAPARPPPRLYLATPIADVHNQLIAALPDAPGVADIAAVLPRLRETDQRGMISRVKRQGHRTRRAAGRSALLLDGHVKVKNGTIFNVTKTIRS